VLVQRGELKDGHWLMSFSLPMHWTRVQIAVEANVPKLPK
jgi:hypothetical protein